MTSGIIQFSPRPDNPSVCKYCGLPELDHLFGMGNLDDKIGECQSHMHCDADECEEHATEFRGGGAAASFDLCERHAREYDEDDGS